MFYFLCEGAQGKAECQFVSNVIQEFHIPKPFTLIAADGKNNIEKEFLRLKNQFQKGDIFILFFDSIETIGRKTVADLLWDMEQQCEKAGVSFRYTKYYCFEELFLSYTNIPRMLHVNEAVKEELQNVQKKLLSKVNYFRGDISFWETYFEHRSGVLRTRESLSAGICNDLFRKINGKFYLQKSKIGSCWIADCESSDLHENVCKNCKYPMKDHQFKDKLLDLDCNSVSIFGEPLAEILDT
ncbi:MAG: hypothetical protein ACI4HI_06260 [Lachnospiraceae bacterium]